MECWPLSTSMARERPQSPVTTWLQDAESLVGRICAAAVWHLKHLQVSNVWSHVRERCFMRCLCRLDLLQRHLALGDSWLAFTSQHCTDETKLTLLSGINECLGHFGSRLHLTEELLLSSAGYCSRITRWNPSTLQQHVTWSGCSMKSPVSWCSRDLHTVGSAAWWTSDCFLTRWAE